MSDTIEAPPEGAEPEVAAGEVAEPVEPTEPATPDPIEGLRDEFKKEIERSLQQQRSWLGRRDKELMDAISQKIENLGSKPEKTPEFDFDDPLFVDKRVDQILSQRQQDAVRFQQNVISEAGLIMETDELFQDTEFGNKVVEEVGKNMSKINSKLPAKEAAELLLGTAVKEVLKKQKSQKKTALDGNQPKKIPGTLSATAKSKTPVFDRGKLSPEARKLADSFGYSDEDLGKVFGTKS